ncbi:hypothetical protein OS493_018802 [Desmophyllum pertusum]|uniref:Uncharacterized protein n=1 Tax=Desmophyllum pertusum TaxID=174260 RepID=A0A9W9ZC22_9CNID|nr:hypothetical protein OS493_018802 [Desmophyllum pertusum]
MIYYFTAINPCQSRPCPNNASCHDNETDYTCVPNDKETAYNRIPLKNSATPTSTFNTPFIVVLSVSVALIVLLAAAVVYLILQIRRLTKHQPNTPRVVFSNAAYKGDSADNLDEEVNYSNDVDLGTGTTQTGQDPDPIYQEAPARPLPPIPPPHNTTRKKGTGKTDSRTAAKKANNSYGDVTSTTQAEERYMGLSRTNGNKATPNASGAAGMLSDSYMSLSPAERPGPSSYSARAQTSAGMKQHGNNGKRRKESHEMYENTRK